MLTLQVLEITASTDTDYSLWYKKITIREEVSKNASIQSTTENVAYFSNIFNKFVIEQTKNAELLIYYYYAYIDEARIRLLMTNIKTHVDAGINDLNKNFSSTNITNNMYDMYEYFFRNIRKVVAENKVKINNAIYYKNNTNAISCYESRNQSFYDAVGTANLTNIEKLMSETAIDLKNRATEVQNEMNTRSTKITNDLWYRLYYPWSYQCWTAEPCINKYVSKSLCNFISSFDI